MIFILFILQEKMSKFYANIMNGEEEVERCPEYFRVDFIGRGFPSFLQNKTFIYRGRGFERRGEFVIRIMDQFPDAEEKKKLGAPTQEEKDSPKQVNNIVFLDIFQKKKNRENQFHEIYRLYSLQLYFTILVYITFFYLFS